jgi:hypothetical protein
MYFAFDGLSQESVHETTDALEALQADHRGKPLNMFVLIDGAFDEDFLTKVFGKNSRHISLYDGTPLGGFGEASLFLVEIHEEKFHYGSWMVKLAEASGNRPMWSVIVAAVDINKLAEHLAPFLIAKSDDSLEWPVRWGDARVLPQLLGELEPEFVSDLLQPVYTWFVPSRNGKMLSWIGQGRSEYQVVQYEKLPMSDRIFAKLVDVSEPDMVIAGIYDRQPECLKSLLPSECHRRVAQQLNIADQFGLRQPVVRQHFSMMALLFQKDFTDLPEVKVLLSNVKMGSDYMGEILSLNNIFWSDAAVENQ